MWQMALDLGLNEKKLRWREHEEFERSHYSKKTMDIEYFYPFGWKEMWGLAYRTNYDLSNHMKNSGVDLNYTDQITKERYIPHVIEPTFGLSRLLITLIVDSFNKEEVNNKKRIVLKIKPSLAPIKVAIFPLLSNKKDLIEKAKYVYNLLKSSYFTVFDDRDNIGKRYFAQDEIGTPFCVTIDFKTLDDDTVTVRERDTMKQERVSIDYLKKYLDKKLLV